MKLAERVFRRNDYYITSPFGYRKDPITGVTTVHYGVDYGTHVQKWAQYALEKGIVTATGKDNTSGNYVWVRYPRLGYSLLHCHLDSINIKNGQEVNEETIIGYTGTTGRSTGIHLHLGLQGIGSNVWEDVEKYDYQEEVIQIDPFPGVSDEELARRVWKGEFGNGQDRINALGTRYNSVQALVNKGVGKDDPQPTPEFVSIFIGFKKGEIVVPTRLVNYTGTRLIQYDKTYVVYEDSRNDRVVLSAYRNGKLVVWAAMNIKDVRRV